MGKTVVQSGRSAYYVITRGGGPKRLSQCGVFTSLQLSDIPECDTTPRPIEDFVIAIQSEHDPIAFKMMTLSLPKKLEPSKPDDISKEVQPGVPPTLISTELLPTSGLSVRTTMCILQVASFEPGTNEQVWTTCLADFPDKFDRVSGSLSWCGNVIPDEDMGQCNLRTGFEDAPLPRPAEGECISTDLGGDILETEPATYSTEEVEDWLTELDNC